jgi:hypothetical protein
MFPTAFVVLLGLAIMCRVNARKVGGGGGGRGGGGGAAGGRERFAPILLWTAVVLFMAAGCLAPSTFVGDIVGALTGIHPALAILLFFGMFVAIVRDLWYDKSPDKAAPFALFLLPTITTHIGGWVGSGAGKFFDMFSHIVNGWLNSAIGI